MIRRYMRHESKWRAKAIGVMVLLMLFVMFFSCADEVSAQTTTVILVRHAEKAAEPASDPGLTADGERRARDLAQLARDAGVTAAITTQFARTRATAQPLASALGITPEVVDARGATHVQDVAAAIRKHIGQVVLVVGHSNTIPAIIAALGAAQPPPICDPEYDNVYIVTLPSSGSARIIRARYGVVTPVTSSCTPM